MNSAVANRKILCDIAHLAFGVVEGWLSRDQRFARELRSSKTTSRQIVGEEAITVDLAIKLREQFPNHVDLTLFTHPEETETGADWYWRIERINHAIHARVQAKRVQRTAFGESDEDGYIDIDQEQLRHLLLATRTAATSIVGLQAWLTTYARFRATPPCGCEDLISCANHRHSRPCATGQPSVWIADAQEIEDSGMKVASISQIVQQSIRFDCVLPCIDTLGVAGPAKKNFVLQSGLQSYQDCVSIIESDPQLRSQFKGALRIHE